MDIQRAPQPVKWWWETLGGMKMGRILVFDMSSANNICEFMALETNDKNRAGIEFDNGMIAYIRRRK